MQSRTTASIRTLMVALAALAAGCASTGTTDTTPYTASVHKVDDGMKGKTNVVAKDYNPELVQTDQCGNILQRDPRCTTLDCQQKCPHMVKAEAPAAAAPAPAADAMGGMCAGQSADLPAGNAGQCYVKVWNEPKYTTVMQKTLVKPAGERIDVVPAQYDKVKEVVVVVPARKELRSIPAEYETVTEKVLVRPAYTRTETIPAVYEMLEEKELVKAAYRTWKPGTMTNIQRVDESGQIWCLVEVPAEYRTVVKKGALRSAEQTKSIEVPAEYAEVQKTVLKTPERVVEEEVTPAVTEEREVEKVVVAAKQVKVPVEAEYADIPVKQLAEKGCYAWSQILCDDNMTQDTVTKLQNALSAAGYYTGEPTGKFDEATMAAVKEYERANNLPIDGYLNIETARTLGLLQQ